ncbi:MAG: IPT/TIG domain-containing protein [Verrucomicrobiales bacterium]
MIAFVGDHFEKGRGLYACYSGSHWSLASPIKVIDESEVIACDEEGNPITFSEFDFDQRVGVIHQTAPPPAAGFDSDWDGDRVTLVFVATPSGASIENSARRPWPLYFSQNKGIWTIQVELERDLSPSGSPPSYRTVNTNAASPVPVAQLADVIGGESIDDFTLYDPIAIPHRDAGGNVHDPVPGDHCVAFSALTASGSVKVVRAIQIDSDRDGLLDHWERDGIDIDGDGAPELNLPAMGAKRLRKDLFMEIDWLRDRDAGAAEWWRNRPAPGVTKALADMFADAPVLNPDGSAGVTLHIDAGPGLDDTFRPYSQNMPNDLAYLDGGDLIRKAGNPDDHIDVVYMGLSESKLVQGVSTASMHDIKSEYFGTNDMRAREFAFKYVVLADFHSFVEKADGTAFTSRVQSAGEDYLVSVDPPYDGYGGSFGGHALKIISGTGAGQLRLIAGQQGSTLYIEAPWETPPDATSFYAVLHGSSGLSEVEFRYWPNFHSRPGNDLLMTLGGFGVNRGHWLGNGELQWRTIAHELGHTLGLRHGGRDHCAFKAHGFESLMSYSHQTRTAVDAPLRWQQCDPRNGPQSPRYNIIGQFPGGEYQVIGSYSDGADATGLNEWDYIKYDIFRSGFFLGNSFGKSRFRRPGEPYELTVEDWTPPALDLTPPTVAVTSPAGDNCGFSVGNGDSLLVTAVASDDEALSYVLIVFDKNGDGDTRDPGEEVAAEYDDQAGDFKAIFTGIEGAAGTRAIIALAYDRSRNVGHFVRGVNVAAQSANRCGSRTGVSPSSRTRTLSGSRQTRTSAAIAVPSSGRLTLNVTATPAIRLSGGGPGDRHEATVEKILFNGREIALHPACNPPGCSPAICSSYWVVPPGGGQLVAEILGPATVAENGDFLGHPQQNYTLEVLLDPVDVSPPGIQIDHPAADEFVEIGEALTADVSITDDFAVAAAHATFDINGDGDVDDLGESIAATHLGAGRYQAVFANVSGAPGTRSLRLSAVDSSGYQTEETGFVEVRAPDLDAPAAVIQNPPPGWPIEPDGTHDLSVEILATDNIAVGEVAVFFDTDGDGTDEEATAGYAGANLFTASFPAITGPSGTRTIRAQIADTAGNVTPVDSPVTVGGFVPVESVLFTDPAGYIPAQSSVFSGGRQQTIDYDPIQVPGSGLLTFTVTATPNVRQEVQNISRADPYVRFINFNGTDLDLRNSIQCNAFGSNPAIFSTTIEVTEGGTLDFAVLGPGTWNIWGEFSGHPEQTYVLEIVHTSNDIEAPEITIDSPARGANLALGAPLTVDLTVTESVELASVIAFFDVNGDGDTDDAGERATATPLGGDQYRDLRRAGRTALVAHAGDPGDRHFVQHRDQSGHAGRGRRRRGRIRSVQPRRGNPGQPGVFNGGSRQTIPVSSIAVPGPGRLTINLWISPVRRETQNLERYDAQVERITFNGVATALSPVCNAPGSDPAFCSSVWDSPGAGTLDIEIRGPAEYNIWGEFQSTPDQDYTVEVIFLPGPAVASVAPAAGSVGGHESVVIGGSGFGQNAVVLFGGIPATNVTWVSGQQLSCLTPPGIAGPVDVRVLNPDIENQPWNYGGPWGLFGEKANAFTYQAAGAPPALAAERLLTTAKGWFDAAGQDDPQGSATAPITLPGAGRVRFETYAFIPIINAIPGPFDDPEDLLWHNTSSSVPRFTIGGSIYSAAATFSDLRFPFGPVIAESTRTLSAGQSGAGTFTILGPARWNAFWRQFGDYVMAGAPAQDWSVGVWFADQPALANVSPNTGTTLGGERLTLTGNHFADGIGVRIGGRPAANVTVLSRTALQCDAPPGAAGSADVSIDVLGMTAQLNGAYTYTPGDEDADGDGLSIFVERFMGLDPDARDSEGALTPIYDGAVFCLIYRRARNTQGTYGVPEWSTDLRNWSSEGIFESTIRDEPGDDYILIKAAITRPEPTLMLRLRIVDPN